MKHQKQQYSFIYSPTRVKNIQNLTLRKFFTGYLDEIDFGFFPQEEFNRTINLRSSCLKFVGEHIKDKNKTLHREPIATEFIKENLVNNNCHIKIFCYKNLSNGFYKDLLDIVRQVFRNFRKKKLGRPWHEPILKKIMVKFPNALASEIPVWKKLKNGKYYIGHIDLNLVNSNTLFIADLKEDETDIIKSLPQITSYGINQKHLIFNKMKNITSIKVKCIVFTKDELWVFNPEFLRDDIIKFIKYANSLRNSDLKSLPFSKGLQRTNLLEDIKKVVFFLQEFINEGEKDDLDYNKS